METPEWSSRITERFEWSGKLRSTHIAVPVQFLLWCLVRQQRFSFLWSNLLMEKNTQTNNFVREMFILITELFYKINYAIVLNANELQPC